MAIVSQQTLILPIFKNKNKILIKVLNKKLINYEDPKCPLNKLK